MNPSVESGGKKPAIAGNQPPDTTGDSSAIQRNSSREKRSRVRRASSLKSGFYKIIEDYRKIHGEHSVESGADKVNIFILLKYLATFRMDRTGLELPLRDEIIGVSRLENKKCSPEDVFSLSLKLNQGNIYKALLTAHNCMKLLCRQGNCDGDWCSFPKMTQRNFFAKYLNEDFTGFYTNDTQKTIVDDVGGNWYYFFGTATMSLVCNRRSHHTPPFLNAAKTIKDAFSTVASGWWPPLVAAPIQLVSDILASVLPYDGISAFLAKKTLSQKLNEKSGLERKHIPSFAFGNFLPEFGATFEQVFFKCFLERWNRSGMANSKWQIDRYSVSQAGIMVGEDLANVRR